MIRNTKDRVFNMMVEGAEIGCWIAFGRPHPDAEADGTPVRPFVFTGVEGKPRTDIKRTWASVCKKAGLVEQIPTRNGKGRGIWRPTVRIHDLRHSFASILVSAGASLPLIGQMLGHTQTQTTARCAHLYDDPLRAAAETVGAIMLPKRELIDVIPQAPGKPRD